MFHLHVNNTRGGGLVTVRIRHVFIGGDKMNDALLCNYIERLRYARRLTLEQFLDGVISLRQYRRYRYGESPIPLYVLNGLAKKLGMSVITLLSDYEVDRQHETKLLNDLYNSIVNNSFEESEAIMKQINRTYILDSENQLYFDYSDLLYQLGKGIISKNLLLLKLLKLITYPNILKQEYLTEIEVLVLSSLLDYDGTHSNEDIYNKLEDYINNTSGKIRANNDYLIPLILMRLSKYQGRNNNLELVDKWCKLGIEISKGYKSSYLIDYFHYYLALTNFKKKKNEEYEHNLYQCFNAIYLDSNPNKIEKFTKLIQKDFNENYHDFIIRYIKKYK